MAKTSDSSTSAQLAERLCSSLSTHNLFPLPYSTLSLQMPTTLLDLPRELHILIAFYLPLTSLICLKMSCPDIHYYLPSPSWCRKKALQSSCGPRDLLSAITRDISEFKALSFASSQLLSYYPDFAATEGAENRKSRCRRELLFALKGAERMTIDERYIAYVAFLLERSCPETETDGARLSLDSSDLPEP